MTITDTTTVKELFDFLDTRIRANQVRMALNDWSYSDAECIAMAKTAVEGTWIGWVPWQRSKVQYEKMPAMRYAASGELPQ